MLTMMAGCKVIVRPKAFEQQVLAWRLATFALWLFITGTLAVLPYPAAGRVGLLCPQFSLQNLLSLRVWGSSLSEFGAAYLSGGPDGH